MKKIIPLLLIVISLLSCSDEKEKPTPFFEHEQMVDLMTDLSLAEGTRMYARPEHKKRKEGEVDLSIEEYYALVLAKYEITQTELDSMNAWYINYPKQYQLVFKDVLERLNKMQAEEKSRRLKKAKSKVIIPKTRKTDSLRHEARKLQLKKE